MNQSEPSNADPLGRTGHIGANIPTLALSLFAGCLFISINLMKLEMASVPIRSLMLLAAGGLLFFSSPVVIKTAIVKARRLLLIIAYAAFLAVCVSLLAGNDVAFMVQQLIELHLQAAIGCVIALAFALHFSVRIVLLLFLAAFSISALVAFGQALGLDPAWAARAAIGQLTNDPPVTAEFYEHRERPMGLSFTPVLFAIQACLAFVAGALLTFLRRPIQPLRFDPWILVVCGLVSIACIATGNRSPLLGIAIFIVIYCVITVPKITLGLLPLAIGVAAAGSVLIQQLSESGVRAARIDDSSAQGRETLRNYGVELIRARPVGYGLAFNSLDHWQSYMRRSRYAQNPNAIRNWALHNYYLNIIAKHGILIIFALALLIPANRRYWILSLFFVPYLVHIYYHNDGPLQGDFLFFYIAPLVILVADRGMSLEKRSRERGWRRAYAPLGRQPT